MQGGESAFESTDIVRDISDGRIIVFDTETNGLDRPRRVLQIAWVVLSRTGCVVSRHSHYLRPDGFSTHSKALAIHGITEEVMWTRGDSRKVVFEAFLGDCLTSNTVLVAHNINFDLTTVCDELKCLNWKTSEVKALKSSKTFCTWDPSLLRRYDPRRFAYRRFGLKLAVWLEELGGSVEHIDVGSDIGAHDAAFDTEMTIIVLQKLMELRLFKSSDYFD